MGLVRASTIKQQLVLCVADIDPLVISCAGVGSGSGAVRRLPSLRGDGLAVRNVSDIRAFAVVRAGSDLLDSVSVEQGHAWIGVGRKLEGK